MIDKPNLSEDVLFIAYRDRIEAEILDALRKHMEPMIREAAAKATEALQVAIQQHYEVATRETIVRVDLRINPEKI